MDVTAEDGVRIYCEIQGEGDLLVLNHGLGQTSRRFREQVPVWSGRFRVVTWDNRGWGRSGPAERYTLDRFAGDAATLIRHVGGGPAVVYGISWGGVLALKLALDHPDLVRALILDSTSSEVNVAAAARWRQLGDAAEREGLAALDWPLDLVTEAPGPEEARAFARACYCVASTCEQPLTPYLGRVTAPTLVLAGEHDRVAGVGGSVILARRIPGAELAIVEGAEHGVMFTAPERFRELVEGFLARL
ncbi:MAG TPA: alpha/beta hydrolase [Dehalococcoidia bacterium]